MFPKKDDLIEWVNADIAGSFKTGNLHWRKLSTHVCNFKNDNHWPFSTGIKNIRTHFIPKGFIFDSLILRLPSSWNFIFLRLLSHLQEHLVFENNVFTVSVQSLYSYFSPVLLFCALTAETAQANESFKFKPVLGDFETIQFFLPFHFEFSRKKIQLRVLIEHVLEKQHHKRQKGYMGSAPITCSPQTEEILECFSLTFYRARDIKPKWAALLNRLAARFVEQI